jgi:hypothetical protein
MGITFEAIDSPLFELFEGDFCGGGDFVEV